MYPGEMFPMLDKRIEQGDIGRLVPLCLVEVMGGLELLLSWVGDRCDLGSRSSLRWWITRFIRFRGGFARILAMRSCLGIFYSNRYRCIIGKDFLEGLHFDFHLASCPSV